MKIKILGYCWKSQMNGAVYDVGGYRLAYVSDSTPVSNPSLWK